ncbi:O-unit flippase-like protein [Limosilactobacillus reuteri subsp. suis]|uniref:O-unit flippase-like protein n=1 Tax=Limosilactobacillus reuteri TaxID=1598 RepID=UPI0039922834
MKINISKSDIIWNYIGIIVSLMGNFLLIPFLLKFLSTDYYGLWNVFISLGAVSVLFDFGFNSLFARNIAYSWSGVKNLSKENVVATDNNGVNYPLLKKVIKTCQLIYLIISSAALLVLVSIGTIYVSHVAKSISNNLVVIIAWELYAIGIFLDLLYGYYDAFLRGIGEIGADNKARVIAKLIQIVLTVVLLFLNFGIISTSIANIVYGLAFRELCKKRFYSYKNMKTRLNEVGAVPISDIFETFKIVWHNAWREGIVSIANYISNQVTTLLCSLYLGLAATAKFGLAVQFTSAVAQIATALLISYQPALQEAYAHRNKEVISAKLSMGVISYVILYPLGLIGLMLFIPVINIIKGSAILTISLLFSVGFYQFILKFRDCYAWYLGSTNRVIYYKSFIFSSVLCTTLSVLFVGYWHLNISGFVYAQIISQLVFNVWYWPLYVHRELHLTLKNMILRFRVQLMRTIKEEI